MKSEVRKIIDAVLEKRLGADRLKNAYVINDSHRTLRRFKYCFVRASDDELREINYDLHAALPHGTISIAYNTHDDPSCYSSRYNGLAIRIFKNDVL